MLKGEILLVIKKLVVQDFDKYKNDLIELIKESYLISFPNIVFSPEYFVERVNVMFDYINKDNAIVYVAIENDIVIGLLWMFIRNYLMEKRLHVNEVVVRQEFRGCGVGSKLINKAIEYAKISNLDSVDLCVSVENINALIFYKNKGFHIDSYLMSLRIK
jgi:ribosomal protein S18 acetylase RimI-like enzyme